MEYRQKYRREVMGIKIRNSVVKLERTCVGGEMKKSNGGTGRYRDEGKV